MKRIACELQRKFAAMSGKGKVRLYSLSGNLKIALAYSFGGNPDE
jgi:hypothetical protein